MTTKMIVRRVGVLAVALLSGAACNRSYLGAGVRGAFDLSGSFDVQAQPVTNSCAEVSTDLFRSRLDVQHVPGEMKLTVVFEGDPYPADVKTNGQFASAQLQRSRGGATEYVTLRGRFRDSTINASLVVQRAPVRTVLPTSRSVEVNACGYHVNIAGIRMVEAADDAR